MSGGLATYLAIGLMAVVTLATRITGAAFMTRIRHTPVAERFLQGLSSSVLVAIVATEMAEGGPREIVSVLVAAATALVTRSPVAAMLAGVGCAAAWHAMAR